MDIHSQLSAFKASKDFLICIDSDGCVFDSMEIKHKECFCPNFIKHWHLQACSKFAREVWDFFNLYSKWRGTNRWPVLVMCLDALREREDVRERGVKVHPVERLRRWVKEESKLGNPALRKLLETEKSEELALALRWSEAVDASIKDMVHDVPPFPSVVPCLHKFREKADIIVVSQTPGEALRREWEEHGLEGYVPLICGQEMGKKDEHIKYTAREQYKKENILMIGDAPGDRKAAEANGALFFPVVPGREEQSWKRLFSEGVERFFSGTYAGAYAQELADEFEASLPEKYPWA